MRVQCVSLVLALLVCGSLAGVARRDAPSLTKKEKETKIQVFLHEPEIADEEEIDISDEPLVEDTRIDLPERDAKFLEFSPINQGIILILKRPLF